MLGTHRKLLCHDSETPTADGGTETGLFSFGGQDRHAATVRERYDVDATRLEPDLPAEARGHFDGLLNEIGPEPAAYVPAYETADIGPGPFVAAHEAPVEGVVDEVKQLANGTREHTERIAGSIDDVQQETNKTVVAVEESHNQIHRAGNEIDDALTALEEIAESVHEVATWITGGTRTNNEQASTVEDVIVTSEELQQQAEEASETSERIFYANPEQAVAVCELSRRIEQLHSEDDRLTEETE